MLLRKLIFMAGLFVHFIGHSQVIELPDKTGDDEMYYIGINPLAAITGIRSEFTSLYLPYISNQETGIAVFVGKIWNNNYNVETRLSFGSPLRSYNMFQVHSGFNYCFTIKKQRWHPYAGVFLKLQSLHSQDTKTDYVSTIAYVCAGNRFMGKKYFLDLRINQNVYALSWANLPGAKVKHGFHDSIYKWKSSYIPYLAVSVGFLFR
jgi:hypothetical protein